MLHNPNRKKYLVVCTRDEITEREKSEGPRDQLLGHCDFPKEGLNADSCNQAGYSLGNARIR